MSNNIRQLSKAMAREKGLVGMDNLFDVSRQSVWKAFKKAANRAEINTNIGTHTMRKTYSKKYIEKGHNLLELQQRLNHSKIIDTIGYITSNSDLGLDNTGRKKTKKGRKT